MRTGAERASWRAVALAAAALCGCAGAVGVASARPHASAAVPRCTLNDVRLIYTGNEGAAGTLFTKFHYLHRGSGKCSLRGYPAVTLLGNGGRVLAVRVGHDHSRTVRTRVISKGHPGYFTIVHPSFDPATTKPCAKRPRRFRIVAPGQSQTLTVPAESSERFCAKGARVTPVGARQ